MSRRVHSEIIDNSLNRGHRVLTTEDSIELIDHEKGQDGFDSDGDHSANVGLVRPLAFVGELHMLSEEILRSEHPFELTSTLGLLAGR